MNIRPAWAEIDLSAIASNIKELRKVTAPAARIMGVVKANAYGHGAVQVSKTLLDNGISNLAVAILDEAKELREAGFKNPILILGYIPPEQLEEAIEYDLAITVYNLEGAVNISQTAARLGKTARVHIKIDTGMGRLGFPADMSTPEMILKLSRLPLLNIEGIFTHFAVADIKDKDYTYKQFKKFTEIDEKLQNLGVNIPVKHVSNSAAIIDLPDVHLNMVRAGISLYGLYPSNEVIKERVCLKPALSLKAKIASVKSVPPGFSISYGRTYTTSKDTIVATIPVGYADGYSRLLSNKSQVLIKGKRCKVIGTICMDQFMVDVTHVPEVKPGDEAVLIGKQGTEIVTADELADIIGTINYEIVCMISDRIPRIYVNG